MENQEILKKIQDIDLEPVIFNLTQGEDGPKWTLDHARKAEKWYRRFLFLAVKYPSEIIVPTKEIDQLWHFHILDTRKYIEDCNTLFGEYFHHFPYLGTRGKDDKRSLENAFLRSLALFEFHFNQMPIDSGKESVFSVCGGGCGGRISNNNISGVDLTTRPIMGGISI